MSGEAYDMKQLIGLVAGGERLTVDQARAAFEIMMSGDATPAQIGGFLIGLRVRGETVDEITGGVMTMRAKALAIDAPEGAIDTVGTGGDAHGTYNISTAAALVVAGAGVPVAKHGNRAASSKCGAADVLAALGVNLDADMELVRRSLWDAGICFMMAPRHHGAMRNVGGPRVELGTRTIFNLLGPLSNPAGVKRLLVGVFARAWVEPMAEVLGKLGAERAWVVHGADGMDELTTTGPSYVAELADGAVRSFEVSPEGVGIPLARLDDLKGGDAEHNAAAIRAVLEGEPGPFRDIVVYNAGAALIVAGRAADHTEGVALAGESIVSGAAKAKLASLVRISNEGAGS
ncbi:MAG: anthranilate phosphoribosyltransferase [Proteobacteria bacterium]|nr:anthranilate phosphoribosyltransferase [Pseudomonadota bacterium]